jgi:hypothetical protein
MSQSRRARCYDPAGIRAAREGRDGALDLAGVAHANRAAPLGKPGGWIHVLSPEWAAIALAILLKFA